MKYWKSREENLGCPSLSLKFIDILKLIMLQIKIETLFDLLNKKNYFIVIYCLKHLFFINLNKSSSHFQFNKIIKIFNMKD